MSVSIENTSGIPAAVWIVGLLILAAVILYAISRGHNVKIGPVEFESKGEQPNKQASPGKDTDFTLDPSEKKKIDPAADPLTEGKGHLFGKTRQLDYELAYLYLKKAASAGIADAYTYLGYMYDCGMYVDIDFQKAMSLYKKSTEHASPAVKAMAMNNIGFMYQHGHGVAQDYKAAASWYIKAADLGSASAQNNAGFLYKNGLGVPQDYEKALQLYRKAIDHGSFEAMNNLGVMYEYGTGVQQDIAEALSLYRKAAEKGVKNAISNLERLKKNSPELFQ